MIDSKAVIDPTAELDVDVTVGPFSVIGAGVRIGRGTVIGPHAVVKGPTTIGEDNHIFQFSSVGEDPQDKKYAGEQTHLEIGDRNVIREFCTINRGTAQDAVSTRIGNDNLLMAYTHVAHDCQLGNNVILANAASLGGHVVVGDWAIMGGFSMAHQFSHLGAHTFCAMGSVINKDVPPYVTVSGHPARPYGINSEGLRRRGYSDQQIMAIKRGYKLIYKQHLTLEDAIVALRGMALECSDISLYVDFLTTTERGIVR